ncbi:MAG TPA: tetratricopeptide repeat protein, partial [Nannocystaceae bacterium]|nr:tetratricopeptide repeat protein [Nannocystaceae bacterium]
NLRVGRHAEADAAASELLGRARAHGEAATIAAVALASARARSELGDGQAAHDRASETLWTAIAIGDDRLAFDAAFELVWIDGVDLGEPQVADDFAQTAEASLVRLGDEPRERMRLAKQLGGVWGIARDFTRARAELGKARALAEQLGETRTAIDVRADLATLDFHENEPVRAVSELREVVAWYERELGDRHPRVANTLGNLAQAELLAGDGKAARATVTRAVALARAAVGDRHPSTIELLGVQGHVLAMLDDVPAALAVSREALAALSALYGPDDRRLTGIETRLADLLARTGDFDGAIAHAEHALAINELTYGGESSGTADAVHYLARVRGMKGDRRADASFERAATIYAALGDVESEVMVLNDHVHALAEQKRSDEALAHARAAWARAQQLPERSLSRASTGMELAMIDDEMPLAQRRALVAQGREVWRSVGVDAATLAIADAWLSNHPALR